jgi:hypothetical protein
MRVGVGEGVLPEQLFAFGARNAVTAVELLVGSARDMQNEYV